MAVEGREVVARGIFRPGDARIDDRVGVGGARLGRGGGVLLLTGRLVEPFVERAAKACGPCIGNINSGDDHSIRMINLTVSGAGLKDVRQAARKF